jgi:putative endonuclease
MRWSPRIRRSLTWWKWPPWKGRATTADRVRRAPEALPPARPLRERVGHAGEHAALSHLKDQGFRILARDWRSRIGQIDIVAEDGETLVIVEVKARRGVAFGLPEEAVDARKRQKLRMLLETYRSATKRQKQPCRNDVLGLLLDEHMVVTRCEHIRDAVQGE